jgi:predicted amidohydrolase
MTSTSNLTENLAGISDQLEKFKAEPRPDLISLPENALLMRLSPKDGSFAKLRDQLNLKSDWSRALQTWADRLDCAIHLGSMPLDEGRSDGRMSNATVWYEPNQPARVVYRKIHLFDVDVDGAPAVRESRDFAPGNSSSSLEWRSFKIGLSICYDIRFSSLYLSYAKVGCDLLLIPSSFLVPTGRRHWEILNRARAIEAQAFVVSAAQSGRHQSSDGQFQRETYGQSLIVGPWGQVLSQGPVEETGFRWVQADLDRESIRAARGQIPMSSHRVAFREESDSSR